MSASASSYASRGSGSSEMVKGMLRAAERAGRRRFRVEALYEVDRIRALLEPRRIYAAYAVGQLAPDLFPLVDCWRASAVGDGQQALVLYSRGGLGDAMFTMGESEA